MRAQREGDVRRWWRPGLWLGGKWARDSWVAFICLYRVEPVMNSRQPGALIPPSEGSRTLRGRCGGRAARVLFGHVA